MSFAVKINNYKIFDPGLTVNLFNIVYMRRYAIFIV
jgi:hypothetical protein